MRKDPNELKGTSIRLPEATLARIDRWAKKAGVLKRSDAIRMLLTEALEAHDRAKLSPAMTSAIEKLRAKDANDAAEQLAAWFLENDAMQDIAPAEPLAKKSIAARLMGGKRKS